MYLSMGLKPLKQEQNPCTISTCKHIYIPTQSQNKWLRNERFNQLADLSKCCQTVILINIFFTELTDIF